MKPYALHWFRRDLRATGNLLLNESADEFEGRVLGVFCFDRKFLARPDFSHSRFLFFLNTLEKLRDELRANGGDLLFLDEGPEPAFRELFEKLKKSEFGLPSRVTFHRDYEPFARIRDEMMSRFFEAQPGVELKTARDHLLIEPSELTKPDGGVYQVFTPFSKKWYEIFKSPEINRRLRDVGAGIKRGCPSFSMKWPKSISENHLLESVIQETQPRVSITMPEPGFDAAKSALRLFHDERIENYPVNRDIPSLPGTSQISIYLKNGSITVPQIIALLKLTPDSQHIKYFTELVWREFYYHILTHYPRVENEAFNQKYKQIAWENREDYFEAWKAGKTGYPIVDAGMRQLNETGWMHNRVRMIVASFLTKDLLIDWRWGERYFMEKLLDGDLAPNNGGWQWAASTGCDPQPYFRIFNPTSQGEKFDPDGTYVKRWVPELKNIPAKTLHQPRDSRIVEHSVMRDRALKLFKECSS